MNNTELERRVIQLVAADRFDIPVSSMSGKLKRMKPKLAKNILGQAEQMHHYGERVFAYTEQEDKDKAKGMREGVEEFKQEFPKYGQILEGKIQEKRAVRETHLYFGMQPGKRLTGQDYLAVMNDLGFTLHNQEDFMTH
jgi:hypothetical protein